MTQDIITILTQAGGVVTNSHIVYTSGKHGSEYLNKDALYPHTTASSMVGELFAEQYKNANIEVVVAPALGGIVLSQWTAHHLSKITGREVLGVYTEKTATGEQALTRGYEKLIFKKQVLVVEDITTTGESARKVVRAVQMAGGQVVAVAVMINRNPSEVTSEYFGVPFTALAEFVVEAFEPTNCPLCEQGMPINTLVGKGRQFLEQQGKFK